MRIFDNIEKNAEVYEDKNCMVYGKEKITYNELVSTVKDMAQSLRVSLNMGEKIIIKLSNPIRQIITLLACSKAGIISILVEEKLNQKLLDNIIEKTKASCIIEDDFILSENKKSLPNISKNDIFLGALSSGTTGEHKVIWRDHESWRSAFEKQSQVFSIDSNDTLFLCGSLVYTANLNSALHILNEGGSVIFSQKPYPRTWIKEIIENKVTTIFMVPSHYRILVRNIEKPFFQIKVTLSAGEKMDKKTVIAMQEVFPKAEIWEYYGASELGHITYINGAEILKGDSVGKAFPGVELWIENKKIWVKSPYIAPFFKPKATVGDKGRFDDMGNLYLLGRENDIINKGGVKILPSKIEKVLNSHPKIVETVVLGVEHHLKGREVAAFIVRKTPELIFEDIIEYCRRNLEKHFCPQRIKFVESIPLTRSGKVNKKALKELL